MAFYYISDLIFRSHNATLFWSQVDQRLPGQWTESVVRSNQLERSPERDIVLSKGYFPFPFVDVTANVLS